MKLRKISFEDALNQWYARTFDEKDMSKNDFEKLKDSLKKEYEKRHGKE
jgi:hypothetical protein